MVGAYVALVGVLALQRLGELWLSRRNTAWARAAGAVEHGRGNYPFMVVLHTAFLFGCVAEVVLLDRPFQLAWAAPMAALLVGAQALRAWTVHALGPRWNTRVFVLPDAAPVFTGPYAFMRHPGYLAVAIEGLALPLLHGAWITATAFTAANTVLLAARIRCEDRALHAPRASAAPRRSAT
jgi:methyltransferase